MVHKPTHKKEIVQTNYLDKGGGKSPFNIAICKAGKGGCKHALLDPSVIAEAIDQILHQNGLAEHILSGAKKKLLYHRKFRVAVAACPNSCSQPQIKDFGLNAQAVPVKTDKQCIECMKCVKVCKESGAIRVESATPLFDYNLCMLCGDCERICPTGSIMNKQTGMKVMSGGRLGRHPRLGKTIAEIKDNNVVIEILKDEINKYVQLADPFSKINRD